MKTILPRTISTIDTFMRDASLGPHEWMIIDKEMQQAALKTAASLLQSHLGRRKRNDARPTAAT